MPGLLRGVARTAVVAGTATAVSGRVARRQQGRFAAQEQQAQASSYEQQGPPPAYAEPAPAEDDMTDKIEQLRQLAELNQQGILTDEEFQTQKQRILG